MSTSLQSDNCIVHRGQNTSNIDSTEISKNTHIQRLLKIIIKITPAWLYFHQLLTAFRLGVKNNSSVRQSALSGPIQRLGESPRGCQSHTFELVMERNRRGGTNWEYVLCSGFIGDVTGLITWRRGLIVHKTQEYGLMATGLRSA